MKQKQVTFVLMLMSIVFTSVLNVKAQKAPSIDDYNDDMLDYLQQNHNEYPVTDNFYPEISGTDYAKTKIAIKKAFNAWQARSDFETSEEYETRLRDNSVAKFDELCIKYVRYTVRDKTWAFDPVKYNIDKQEYTIDFYESYYEQIYSKNFKIRIVVPMETDVARRYKHLEDFEAYQVKTYYSLFFMINEKFVPSFFSHRSLYIDNSNYTSAKEITFTAAGCGISNKYLTGYTCHVCEIWKNQTAEYIASLNAKKQREIDRKKQKRINDSLAIIEYKKQVGALLADYNKKLLEDKYNIEKKQIKFGIHYRDLTFKLLIPPNDNSYYEIYHVEDDPMPRIKDTYERAVDEITKDYESYSASIKHEYEAAKTQYFRFFETEQEFDTYYCQGSSTFTKKVEELQFMSAFNSYIEENAATFRVLNLQRDRFEIVWYEKYIKNKSNITEYVNKYKNTDYYPRMISTIVKNNWPMNNEYHKTGFLFNSEIDFYNTYISETRYKEFVKLHKKEIKAHNQGNK